jgi:hypothetical protein
MAEISKQGVWTRMTKADRFAIEAAVLMAGIVASGVTSDAGRRHCRSAQCARCADGPGEKVVRNVGEARSGTRDEAGETVRWPTRLISPHRAARCAEYANDGNATILMVSSEEERAEAQGLVGQSPVIIASGSEALAFLRHWVPFGFGSDSKRTRGR